MASKYCCACGRTRDVEEFGNDVRRPDGCQPHCRDCRNIRARALRAVKAGDRAEWKANLTEKKCTKCSEVKSLDAFTRDARRQDGRKSACKLCENAGIKALRNRRSKSVKESSNVKVCIICDETKYLSDFHPDRRHAAGVAAKCRECANSRTRALRAAKVRSVAVATGVAVVLEGMEWQEPSAEEVASWLL